MWDGSGLLTTVPQTSSVAKVRAMLHLAHERANG
jgi:hypothetical protein